MVIINTKSRMKLAQKAGILLALLCIAAALAAALHRAPDFADIYPIFEERGIELEGYEPVGVYAPSGADVIFYQKDNLNGDNVNVYFLFSDFTQAVGKGTISLEELNKIINMNGTHTDDYDSHEPFRQITISDIYMNNGKIRRFVSGTMPGGIGGTSFDTFTYDPETGVKSQYTQVWYDGEEKYLRYTEIGKTYQFDAGANDGTWVSGGKEAETIAVNPWTYLES
ncbi:MAG: hypothetical protein LBT21_00445 [Oscillospiraceae bacterium]|nr:hypothetical protein [Oscillospiraceae bacterium]